MSTEKKIKKVVSKLKKADLSDYRSIPFWSWNSKLEKEDLISQIKWMKSQGFGGYFMHARGGLTTEYLGDEWFDSVKTCLDEGKKQKMYTWAYDENGWPSGFAGGKLLEDPENQDECLSYKIGKFDKNALVSYELTEDEIIRVESGEKNKEYLNLYERKSNATADILNPEVVNKFLDMTHNEYKRRLDKKFKGLCGFFTDEPQYYRWGHPYTKVLKDYFREKYNEDIFDGLGLMFVEKKGYRQFRYRYWKGMQELLVKNYAKNVYNWCNNNGVGLTGHYIEESSLVTQMWCCGGIMPLYEYENIPGMDHLGRSVPRVIVPKQVSSVAKQLGKKQVLTETFALCGWGVTPRMLKVIAESQYVNGVNLMCEHLLPYAENGQRKRDYPAHFSAVNPWVKEDFKGFNDYFAKLGYLLTESKEKVNVGLFCPIRSLYFDYKRFREEPYEADTSYINLAEKLSAMNIPYHIIDETIMREHGKVVDGKLIIGECEYDYVVFPKTVTMDKESKATFEEFYSQGGKMLFTEGKPGYVEGEECEYKAESNITLDDIVKAQEYGIDVKDSPVRSTLRSFNGEKFIFAVNTDWNNPATVEFSGDFKGLKKLDLETYKVELIDRKVKFNAGDSFVLFLTDEVAEKAEEKNVITLDGKFKIADVSDNFLVLDKLSYSLDGKSYSEPLRYMGVFNELLNKRVQGDVYLKYNFTVKEKTNKMEFLAEDMHIAEFTVNGKKAEFTGVCDVEKRLLVSDIKDLIKVGENEAVLKINFYEAENVYYVLFSDDDTESLKNCLTFDTTIEACFIRGDFGVYSEGGFKKGKEKNTYLADGFYIGKANSDVENTVTEGYPFFAGNMKLFKEFTATAGKTELVLNGDYCLAYIKINGKEVKKSYFANVVDISEYVVSGTNTAEITLYSGNRNLLGPHHLKEHEEPFIVSRDSFELEGTWKNGVSSKERKNYSFLRFGIYNENKK